jgi:hypothetical protein
VRKCCEVEVKTWRTSRARLLEGYRRPEQFCNERDLPNNMVVRYPFNLAFPDHVHCFYTLNRAPHRIEGSETLTGSDPAFCRPVVLLPNII